MQYDKHRIEPFYSEKTAQAIADYEAAVGTAHALRQEASAKSDAIITQAMAAGGPKGKGTDPRTLADKLAQDVEQVERLRSAADLAELQVLHRLERLQPLVREDWRAERGRLMAEIEKHTAKLEKTADRLGYEKKSAPRSSLLATDPTKQALEAKANAARGGFNVVIVTEEAQQRHGELVAALETKFKLC